jgi:amino acid transporter
MMSLFGGSWAAILLSLVVCCTALSTINGCIFTGARVYHALGRDVPPFTPLGTWRRQGGTPARALAVQGAITLLLILFGALSKSGLEAMVAYTAPVFWLFMLMTALAVIQLRRRDGASTRSFRVPLYPLPPLLLAATCLALFLASVRYAGAGAWLGLLVLLAGLPLLRTLRV